MAASRTLPGVDLLGVPVRIRSNDPEAYARLEVCYAASAMCGDGDREDETTVLHASLDADEDGWRIDVDDRERRRASDVIAAVRDFNHELLHGVMQRAAHLFYVHAGVVALDERGVVLPGLSRAGKSTLTLALLRAGARFLSDELLAFDPRSGTARAFPRAIKIRDACADYFGDLAHEFVGEGEGRFLPFTALPCNVVRARATVSAVVIPRWEASGPNRLTPISPGAALLSLAGSALNFGSHRAASIEHLADIVQGAMAWELCWREPAGAAALLVDALGQVPSSTNDPEAGAG
jgi:hypothetical protein